MRADTDMRGRGGQDIRVFTAARNAQNGIVLIEYPIGHTDMHK